MKFSIAACSTTIVAVAVSAVVSFTEGTLKDGKVIMGFLCHGGMWGDFILMSTVSGLVIPYLVRNGWAAFISASLAIIVTVVMHAQWATHTHLTGETCHMFPAIGTGTWYLDLSKAGWMHVAVMAGLLTVLFMYSVSPLPTKVIMTASILLTAHVLLAMAQPGWHASRRIWAWQTLGPALAVALLIWIVALLKAFLHARKVQVPSSGLV